jgi:hypothetical protein
VGVDDRGGPEFDSAAVDCDIPPLQMDLLVMHVAQETAISYRGLTAVDPVPHVVRGAYSRWSTAARERTSTVPGDQRTAHTQWHSPHGPPDIQRLGITAQHDRNHLAIARDPASVPGGDQLPVVQGRGTQPSAQGVPVDGHREVGWFTRSGGELLGGAGVTAQLDQSIGLPGREAAVIALTLGGGTAGGELLNQRTDQGAVLGIQPALHPQPPVPTVAQPQLPPDRVCRGRIVAGFGPVRVQGGDETLSDGAQPAGIELARVASQVRLGPPPDAPGTEPGSMVIASVITRSCPVPISPSASAAAVTGNTGASV